MTKVFIDVGNVERKIKAFSTAGQAALDQQVLKDSNKYAPMDTGELIGSSLRLSQFGRGKLIWHTPYARRLYYNPQYNFSKDKNPLAGGLWFRRAKARHLSQWKEQMEKLKKRMI